MPENGMIQKLWPAPGISCIVTGNILNDGKNDGKEEELCQK